MCISAARASWPASRWDPGRCGQDKGGVVKSAIQLATGMREWVNTFVFSHPWELMVEAAYRKYPNPHSTSVKTLDTLERSSTPSEVYSHRLFSTTWNIPNLVRNLVGSNPTMYVNEQSVCNLTERRMTICARNVTLLSLFILDEKLEYTVSPEDPKKTLLTQTARINVTAFPLLNSLLERIWIGQYESTVSKGREGIEFVANKIIEEQKSV